MPAFDLAHAPQTLFRYDVIGQYSDTAHSFIRHVALFNAETATIDCDQLVDVTHMGPPLNSNGRINAHVSGRVPLTNDEIKAVECWIEEIVDEFDHGRATSLAQYVVRFPWKDVVDPNTGIRRYRQFSCAGFVLDAHRQVDIGLLNIDDLPFSDEKMLMAAYPKEMRSARLRKKLDIEGAGPWQVVLAGHVLHALDRPAEEIRERPYQARVGDERY